MRIKTACFLGLFVGIALPFMAKADDLPKDLDAYITEGLKEWKLPGLAIAVVKDGKVIHAKGYGMREAGKGEAVDADTLFAIGSTSKAVTAAAVGVLVDREKFQWNTRVQEVWPEFKLSDPWVSREIRVSDLLANRSGLSAISEGLWYGAKNSREEIIRRLEFVPLDEGFRYQFQYRNAMFLAAGQLVAKVEGKSWDAFITEEFFKPLGMKRTQATQAGWEKLDNVARPHLIGYDGEPLPVNYRDMTNVGPAGSILSSVNDMSRWVGLHLGKGTFEGKAIIKPETIAYMHRSQTPLPQGGPPVPQTELGSYALGWLTESYKGERIVWHNGGIDGMSAWVGLLPEKDFGVVILTNLDNCDFRRAVFFKLVDHLAGRAESEDLNPKLLATFREQVKGRDTGEEFFKLNAWQKMLTKPGKLALPPDAYTGKYRHPALGEVTLIQGADGQLIYQKSALMTLTLLPKEGHEFLGRYVEASEDLRSGKVDIAFKVAEGKVTGFTEDGLFVYERVE